MTHRDASRTPTGRGQTDRAMPAGRRPAPTGAQRGGFTESELALIHATAEAHGLAIEICSVVVPDGTFPPTPDGAPRPEVARILASLRKNTPPQTQAQTRGSAAGFGTLADRHAGATATGPAVAVEAVAPDRVAVGVPSGLASGVAYDRMAFDLDAGQRSAVSAEVDAGREPTAANRPEAGRG